MNSINWKKILPHIIAIAIFLLVAAVYCSPALQGKVLTQSDVAQWKGMSKDQQNYYDTVGHAPLWSNGMFSGMPGYQIFGYSNNVVPAYFIDILSLYLPSPLNFFFLACICFYFLSCVLGIRTWIGILGSLMYAYATFNAVIINVGHDTQIISIALMPGLLASLILLFNKHYWIGAALAAFFTSGLVAEGHYQIIYYSMIIAVFACIAFGITCIQQKEYKHLAIVFVLAAISAGVGAATNAVGILTTSEYAKETIRGGSSLNADTTNKSSGGLDEDYAFSYSMFMSEPFVMMVPHMYGGSSDKAEVSEDKSKAIQALQSMPQELAQQLGYPRYYWGGINGVGTSGPPYVGAIICFLAILGFFIVDNKYRWWMLACSAIAIIMSWGGYFKEFNGFLVAHLPMYNKFRAPSMIIVIPTLLFGTMATLALDKLIYKTADIKALLQPYKKVLITTGAVFLVLFLMYMSFDYLGDTDKQVLKQVNDIPQEQIKQPIKDYFSALQADRKDLFLDDILRALFFIAVVAGMLWLYLKSKVKLVVVSAVICGLCFIDLITVDKEYLNTDDFVSKDDYSGMFNPTPADIEIMKDKSSYRVFDLSRGGMNGVFNEAMTSYFHKSIGGYHPAKLSIYQDLIENQLSKFPNCLPVIDMLNTKYVISQDGRVQQNPGALGDAWFVKAVQYVPDAKHEMSALTNFNPKDTVIVQDDFKAALKPVTAPDSTATISMISNHNDTVIYKSKSATEQIAVFSEVYYKEGWNVYVDGKKTDYAKVNYVLRGMNVPAGEHTIEFRFEPESHKLGWEITSISSWIMILLLIPGIYFEIKSRKKLTVAAK